MLIAFDFSIFINLKKPRYNIPGGVQPTNRLGKPAPNPQFKQPRPAAPKAFDLHAARRSGQREEEENPHKRRRTSGPHTISNGSSRSPIDLDGAPAPENRHSVLSSTKSGQSQTRDEYDRSVSLGGQPGLADVRRVNRMMKYNPRNRKGSSDNKPDPTNGHPRFKTEGFDRIDSEDQNDRISDDEDSLEVKFVGHGRSSKPNKSLEVQIQGSEGSPYKRPQGQIAAASIKSNGPPLETASRYFQSNRGRILDQEDYQIGRQAPHMTGRPKQNLSLLSQDDQDELSTDQYGHVEHANTAQKLLRRNQPAKHGDKEGQDIANNFVDSSEDEISNKKMDIVPGTYGRSKISPRNPQGEDSYIIHQLFSETEKWLLPEHLRRWIMVHDKTAGLLAFYERENELVFQFSTKELERIELANGYTKMVLHKSRTQVAARSTHFYVELGSPDECEQLFENLKSRDSVIGRIPKSRSVSMTLPLIVPSLMFSAKIWTKCSRMWPRSQFKPRGKDQLNKKIRRMFAWRKLEPRRDLVKAGSMTLSPGPLPMVATIEAAILNVGSDRKVLQKK